MTEYFLKRTLPILAVTAAAFFGASAPSPSLATQEDGGHGRSDGAGPCLRRGEKEDWHNAFFDCREPAYQSQNVAAKFYYAKSIYMSEKSAYQQSVEEALRMAHQAEDGGHPEATLLIGLLHQKGTFPNYKQALSYLEKAYAAGRPEAAAHIAMMYYAADKLNNVAKAKEWFAKAAEHDIMAGQYGLGLVMFEEGRAEEAAEQFRKAAEKGEPQAMIALSRFYSNGIVYPKDKIRAIRWLKLAVSAGRSDMRSDLTALLSSLTDAERLQLLREKDARE
jgi:TPR repeat protein